MNKWEKIDSSTVKMEIKVPPETVDEALNKAYKKVVKDVTVPGFRKGKVPRAILENRFGAEVLYEDALEVLVPKAYEEAIKEEDFEPIDQPDVELVQMEKGKELIFSATIKVKPAVELGEYIGIEVEKQINEIKDEMVEFALENERNKNSRLLEIEEAADKGDLVVIDFKGTVDGEAFSGGEAEGHSLELGSGSFIPGFEEQLIGVQKGEERDVKVTFPEEYQAQELAGKDAVFHVKVNEVKRKELPELNDEFAKEVSEFDTLEEYKKSLLEDLKEEEEKKALQTVEDELVVKIAANSEVEVPEIMVERELDRIIAEMEQILKYQGLDKEKYLEATGKTEDELRDTNREEAEKRVKANLTLDAIIQKEGIEAKPEEVEKRIQKFAQSYGQDPENIRAMFTAQGQLQVLEEEVKFRSVIDFLVSKANIKTVVVTPEDLAKENNEEKEEVKEDN